MESFSHLKQLRHFSLPKWTRYVPEIYQGLERLESLTCLFTNDLVPIHNLRKLEYYRFRYDIGDEPIPILPPPSLRCITISLKFGYMYASHRLDSMISLINTFALPIVPFFPIQFKMEFYHSLSKHFPSFTPREWITFGLIEIYYFDLHHECSTNILSYLSDNQGE